MKSFNRTVLVALCMLFARPAVAEILVENGYVRGMPPGVANTAAYMTLKNTGSQAMELIGASSPVAGTTMLHTTLDHDGMLHMMHLDSARIPPQGELVLETGGIHIMLMQLKQIPQVGDMVQINLEFSDGSTQLVVMPVRSVLDE